MAKIARVRKDFLHQLSARLIAEYAVLGTEILNTASMLLNKPQQQKKELKEEKSSSFKMSKRAIHGLHRELASIAPATFLQYVRYKAGEADTYYDEMNTRQLKPTQRCHGCWTTKKKTLAQRIHQCDCGVACNRDDNSVAVMLRRMLGNIIDITSTKRAEGVISQPVYTAPAVEVRLT